MKTSSKVIFALLTALSLIATLLGQPAFATEMPSPQFEQILHCNITGEQGEIYVLENAKNQNEPGLVTYKEGRGRSMKAVAASISYRFPKISFNAPGIILQGISLQADLDLAKPDSLSMVVVREGIDKIPMDVTCTLNN